MVDRQPSFLVLQLCLVLVSVIITVRNSKLAGAYGEHAKRKLQYQADSSGFINLDCGASESYTDEQTGLFYESDVIDTKYIDTGKTHEIDPDFFSATYHRQQRHNLRFFPEGKRNCYTLKPIQGGKNNYLIRAVFEYGNYDRKNQTPEFDLHLGVNKWTRMSSAIGMREIIHVPSDAYIDVCLINTGNGVPYISALELRPLDNSLYRIPNGALRNIYSYDLGGNNDIRYPEDVFDRYWFPYNVEDWKVMISNIQSSDDGNNYKVPDQLLKTAATPKNANVPLSLDWNNFADSASVCYIYFHFANLFDDELSREMMIELKGVRNISDPVVLEYLKPKTINSTGFPISGQNVSFKIYAAGESDLPPILNAVEVFLLIELPDSPTNFKDVDAIRKIKSVYGLKRDSWQGDPCFPIDYMWDGLNCSNDGSSPPRIISLDLSWGRLKGEIAPYFADLTMIKYLDLSNNELTGRVPDLSQLTSLSVLNLRRNKLSGLVPAGLIERSNNRALNLSVEENPDICSLADSCDQKKKNNIVVPLVASIAAFSTALIAIFAIFCWLKKRKKQAVIVLGKSESKSENKNDTFAAKKQQFTYSDIVKITKNFEKVLGKGGFGTVYHGYLDDTEVAVKLLSSSSAQGYKEFHSEVKLLMRVHHRNLTGLVGYCIEGTLMGIIYEYMTNGSLEQYFSGKHEGKNAISILSWDDRMRIAVDAAQGLEYLHEGCKPPIVHRDVKSSNILLNDKFQAKIADFGMSRIFLIESGSHICTGVVGTPGYLDPEYYSSNWLNEKSDTYSFGVVLLEIITSKPVILTAPENTHISKWVNSMLAGGDIRSIIDPKLSGDFEKNSAWKAVELALSCTSQSSSERPTMIEVVMELKECLALAIAGNGEGNGNKTKGPRRMLSVDVIADQFSPSAR